MKRHTFCYLVFLATIALHTKTAPAQSIVNSVGLGPSAIVESFEGITGNGNNLAVNTSAVALPTGVVILPPNPPRFDSSAPFIVNGGFFGLFGADPLIPSGTAYFGQANPSLFDDGIVFQLPVNTVEVGAFLGIGTDSSPNAAVEISIFDAAGNQLDSTIRNADSGVTSNWAQNFVGFQSNVPIDTIKYDGFGSGVLRIDDLQFVTAIPEPSSALIAMITLSLVPFSRRRSV